MSDDGWSVVYGEDSVRFGSPTPSEQYAYSRCQLPEATPALGVKSLEHTTVIKEQEMATETPVVQRVTDNEAVK